MSSITMVDVEARESVAAEIESVSRATKNPPELDDIRHRMPRANGDQDTW